MNLLDFPLDLLGCSCSRQPSGLTTKMAAIESWRTSMRQEMKAITYKIVNRVKLVFIPVTIL
jgi:hypothetical protein